jgi:hypothetical protein
MSTRTNDGPQPSLALQALREREREISSTVVDGERSIRFEIRPLCDVMNSEPKRSNFKDP